MPRANENRNVVIPAKAGIPGFRFAKPLGAPHFVSRPIPAFAGMTFGGLPPAAINCHFIDAGHGHVL